jgi:lipoyl(octanoyl) transferase
MKPKCEIYQLGLVPYEQAWDLQNRLAAEIASGTRPETLLLLEHPHTYTFGRSGHKENLLWDEPELVRRGIHLHWVDRGGDITYHGPGQLVGYPLLKLSTAGLRIDPNNGSGRLPQADYVGYLRKLEKVLIKALADLGVVSWPVPGLTGVWLQPKEASFSTNPPVDLGKPVAKIAAIGVKVDVKGVSRHGFALNVNPDMSYWDGIIGCGLQDTSVTSLAEILSPVPTMQQVSEAVIQAFGEIFEYEMVETDERKPLHFYNSV